MWTVRILAAALVVLLSQAVGAQVAERPQYHVGDRWIFEPLGRLLRPRVSEEVVAVSESEVLVDFTGVMGRVRHFTYTPELNFRELVNGEMQTRLYLNFPLAVGKSWSSSHLWSSGKGRDDMERTVTAYEKVTIPAGTFDAFRIEGTGFAFSQDLARQQLPPNLRRTETYWYVPELRHIVKFVGKNTSQFAGGTKDMGGDGLNFELVEFMLVP